MERGKGICQRGIGTRIDTVSQFQSMLLYKSGRDVSVLVSVFHGIMPVELLANVATLVCSACNMLQRSAFTSFTNDSSLLKSRMLCEFVASSKS